MPVEFRLGVEQRILRHSKIMQRLLHVRIFIIVQLLNRRHPRRCGRACRVDDLQCTRAKPQEIRANSKDFDPIIARSLFL